MRGHQRGDVRDTGAECGMLEFSDPERLRGRARCKSLTLIGQGERASRKRASATGFSLGPTNEAC